MTIILAVDPGGTSGWALATITSAENLRASLEAGQESPAEIADRMRQFCLGARREGATDRILVMERFTITSQTGRKTSQPDALELIGLGRYLAQWSGVEFDVSQAPGDAKAFAHNNALRAWGVWVPAQEHARDALRHLLLKAMKLGVYLG